MPLFWLRFALILYGVGLVYAMVSLWGARQALSRIALPLAGLGVTFHFVALVENAMLSRTWAPSSMHELESLLSFLLMVFFFVIYARYKATAPGLVVFPLVVLMTASAAFTGNASEPPLPLFVSVQWIYIHVALIFIGYAAVLFNFVASILYIVEERALKAKALGGLWTRLPALLVWGFPFMTLGLIAGSVLAEARFGSRYFLDPKIVLSILMWVVYTVLLYTRWSAGWRGRRAAYLATFAFVAAVVAWAANNLSQTHRFIAP
jgi:ABC-type uncharacterized transport system permease subunit